MRFHISSMDLIGVGVLLFGIGLAVGLLRLIGLPRDQALYLVIALIGFALWIIARHMLNKEP